MAIVKYVWEESTVKRDIVTTVTNTVSVKWERKLIQSKQEANFVRRRGEMLGEELLVHWKLNSKLQISRGQSLTYVCVCERVCMFVCVYFCVHACVYRNVCHSCDGRNRWAGEVDSCAWGILWRWGSECRLRSTLGPSYPLQHMEPVQHQPSWTSPPRHLSPRTDNPPPSSSFSALCPRQPRSSATPPPSWNQEIRPNSYMDVMCCFLELWEDRRNLERWLKEEMNSQVHLKPM